MILLDLINLDEISTVNSMREKKMFEPSAKVGATRIYLEAIRQRGT